MVKLVVLNVPGHGHVNPTLAVVAELVRRGHEVVYYNTADFRAKIEAAGASFRAYPDDSLSARDINQAVGGHNVVRVSLLLMRAAVTLMPFAVEALRREAPDAVIVDSVCLWGGYAAQSLNLPTIASHSTYISKGTFGGMPLTDKLAFLAGVLPLLPAIVRARRRLSQVAGPLPDSLFPVVGGLNIVYTSRELQPDTAALDDRFRFVGPSLRSETASAPLPLPTDAPRPWVYVSLGTVHTDPAFLRAAVAALAGRPGTLLLSTGADPASLGPLPPNVVARASMPQLALLAQVDAFVTHAGMNSTQEALYYGAPMVLAPQQTEQLLNARQVARVGAGVIAGSTWRLGHTSAADLRAALDRVLGDTAYATHAQRVAQGLRQAGGPLRAADEIEAFVAAGQAADAVSGDRAL